MGKIIVSEFITLDGVMEGPGPVDPFPKKGWMMPYANAEINKIKLQELIEADAMLLGKNTFEGFAGFWPNAPRDPDGFTARMNSIKKFVVSHNPLKIEWENSENINKDVINEIRKLKTQEDKKFIITGSNELINSLIPEGIIDEYRLLVIPVVIGMGKKLFKEGHSVNLELLDSKNFDNGVVYLQYGTSMT
jgi:dihydrofolate reductase